MSKVGVFLANGFEEIEGLTVVDVLRRAGIEVDTISITKEKIVTGSHQITVLADTVFEDYNFSDLDGLVLPGGPGHVNLGQHEGVMREISAFYGRGQLVAAICAAPGILAQEGILTGKHATSFPAVEGKLIAGGAILERAEAVRDGEIITGRSMGTAIPFALALVTYYLGTEKAEEIRQAIVYDYELPY